METAIKKKSKTTLTVPRKLKTDIDRRVIDEGYGLRGKSKWISEAIEDLISLPDYTDYVEIEEFSRLEDKIAFYLEPHLEKELQTAVAVVRKKHLTLEGVRSKIMRTAIIQKLVRGGIS